jgi:hypothetical protein
VRAAVLPVSATRSGCGGADDHDGLLPERCDTAHAGLQLEGVPDWNSGGSSPALSH